MVKFVPPLLLAFALCGAAPAGATSTSSAASDSLGASSVGSSGSITKSSNASSGTDGQASGDYRITDVAKSDERPGMMRMTLQGTAGQHGGEPLFLHVPPAVAEQSGLGRGDIVHARQRSYGVEFSDGRNRQAFFLVLDDPVHRELKVRAVTL